jgi:short-subunit dehydrogenase
MGAFADRYGPWAVVAGGSDGIGAAFATAAAARGVNVVLVSRSIDKLSKTAEAIREAHGVEVRTAAVDLTAPDVMDQVRAVTDDLDVGLVVYNAGATHGVSRFLARPVEDQLYLVDLSCRGPVLWAHHFGGRLRARGRGGIVLLSSMGAFTGSAFTTTYSATKGFDVILAEGLWRELGPEGVDVLVAVAGLTNTPAMVDSGCKLEVFPLMEPEEVAEGALAALGGPEALYITEANAEAFAGLRTTPRTQVIEYMSQGSAFLYDIDLPAWSPAAR